MTALLTSFDFPSIRAAIDVSLDAETLPDTIIDLDLYAGAAMRDVLARDPLAESRSGAELLRAKSAAVLFAAARLIGSLPQVFKETRADHSYERDKIDSSARAAELRALAEAELASYLDPGDLTSTRPPFFRLAHGYRGRW